MDYKSRARQIAEEYGLDPDIFTRQIGVESSWNPNAVSPKGAQGLGQIMPGTQKDLGIIDPFDPEQSLRGAAQYMKQMLGLSGGNYRRALAKYVQGPRGAEKDEWWSPEAHDYIARILSPERNLAEATAQYGGPMDIQKFRKAFPMYKDKSDDEIAEKLHQTYMPEMEYGQFRQKFGVKPGIWEQIKAVPGALAEGARGTAASAVELQPLAQRAAEHRAIATETDPKLMHEGTRPDPFYGALGLSNIPLPWGAVQMPGAVTKKEVAEAKEAVKTPVEEDWMYKLGNWMRREPTAASDVQAGTAYQIAKNVGQIPTQLGLAMAHPALGIAGTVGMETSDMYRRGKAQGVDEATATRAAMEAAPLGLLDYASVAVPAGMLGRIFGKAGASGNKIVQFFDKYPRLTTTGVGTVGEIGTELIQTYGEDVVARRNYNELVDTYENMKQAGTVAGGLRWLLMGFSQRLV